MLSTFTDMYVGSCSLLHIHTSHHSAAADVAPAAASMENPVIGTCRLQCQIRCNRRWCWPHPCALRQALARVCHTGNSCKNAQRLHESPRRMSERPAGMPLPRKESAAAAAVAAQPAFLLCPLFGDSPKPIPVGREHVLPQEAKPAEGAAGGAAPAEAVLGLRPQCGFAGDQAPHGANVARWHITLRAVPAPGPGAGAAGAVGAAGATQQWQLEAGVHQAAYLQWAGREPVHPVGAGITLLLQPHDRLFLAKQEDAEHYLFGFKVALPGASPLGAPRKRSSQAADGASQPPAKRAARHGWQAGAAAASLGGSRTAADGSSGVQAAEVPEFTPVRESSFSLRLPCSA